jgi:hypothetical protein
VLPCRFRCAEGPASRAPGQSAAIVIVRPEVSALGVELVDVRLERSEHESVQL